MESNVWSRTSSNGTSKAEGNNERHEEEGNDREGKLKGKAVAEAGEQESDDETPRRGEVSDDRALDTFTLSGSSTQIL